MKAIEQLKASFSHLLLEIIKQTTQSVSTPGVLSYSVRPVSTASTRVFPTLPVPLGLMTY